MSVILTASACMPIWMNEAETYVSGQFKVSPLQLAVFVDICTRQINIETQHQLSRYDVHAARLLVQHIVESGWDSER